MKTPQSLAQSITAKLSHLARTQQKPFDKFLTIFLLERMVVRLILDEALAKCLVFKGGYVSIRVYQSPRFTTDVDATLSGIELSDALLRVKRQMGENLFDGAWYVFENEQKLTGQTGYGGNRLSYRAGLGEPPSQLNRSQLIHLDLGIGDPVTPKPYSVTTKSVVGEESISWQVYPVETIIAEKLHALLTKGSSNSRARDVYDVSLLLSTANFEILKKALAATFSYRGDALPANIAASLKDFDTTLLKQGWRTATSHLAKPIDFAATFSSIVLQLTKGGI